MAAVVTLDTWLRLTYWHVLTMTLKFVCFLNRVLFFISNPLFCMRLVASFDNGMLMVAEFIFICCKVNTLSVIFMLFDVVGKLYRIKMFIP